MDSKNQNAANITEPMGHKCMFITTFDLSIWFLTNLSAGGEADFLRLD